MPIEAREAMMKKMHDPHYMGNIFIPSGHSVIFNTLPLVKKFPLLSICASPLGQKLAFQVQISVRAHSLVTFDFASQIALMPDSEQKYLEESILANKVSF